MASGEMTDAEFLAFNEAWIAAVLPCLCDGGVFGTFIDWRGYPTVHSAAIKLGLKPLNLIVWSKTNAGMGSLYRSQHELLPLFKNGTAPHVNNIELGKRGRWRSNVWTYPGASSLGSDARRGFKDHPIVKPTAMLEDAMLDLTNPGDIVLDPFLGSGSTLMQRTTPGAFAAASSSIRSTLMSSCAASRPPRAWQRSWSRPARRSSCLRSGAIRSAPTRTPRSAVEETARAGVIRSSRRIIDDRLGRHVRERFRENPQ
jgi:hypothetical protein